MLFQMVFVDLAFELIAQLTLTEDDESCVGNLLDDEARRLDEMALTLMRHERRDAMSGRVGPPCEEPEPSESASDAIATPCGSWA